MLKEKHFQIIDCTCTVVLGIQKKIREAEGTVIIFGKKGHPEVQGLVGQVEPSRVKIVETFNDARELVDKEELSGHCEIFAQTTRSPEEYKQIWEFLSASIPDLVVHDTICKQVASRYEQLREFASTHDVIVFVSGRSSSNGKVLSELCKSVNFRTYQVGGVSEIQANWFRPEDKVGISGATSTPGWLLEQVASYVAGL